jgi:hypothetical protein
MFTSRIAMRMRNLTRFFLLSTLLIIRGASGATSDDQIVASFFPDSLLSDPGLKGALPKEKLYSFLRADLDATGSTDYIVAAYYNGGHDALRVLRVTPTGTSAAADFDPGYIGGALATLSVVDLDGDGKPEIIMSIPGSRYTQDWIFKWAAGALKLFGPLELDARGRPHTTLFGLTLLDIDGDGIPELLTPDTGHPGTTTVLKLVNGAYAQRPPLVFQYRLTRGSGPPDALDTGVTVSPGNYTVTIVNGDSHGLNRSTAAYLEINGVVLFPESAFRKADRALSATLALHNTNELYFELRSAPGSEITIAITRQ